MTSVEAVLAGLRERADALLADAPGQVSVAKVHQVREVQLLRECRAALEPDELIAIQREVIELRTHLRGIEVTPTQVDQSAGGRLKKLFGVGLALGGTRQAKSAEGVDQARNAVDANRRPPPQALLDAAEAWAIASLAADRIEASVDSLTSPWIEATVGT